MSEAKEQKDESDLSALLVCGECDDFIQEGEASANHDGEACHLYCIAKAEDEAGFDNWFMDR